MHNSHWYRELRSHTHNLILVNLSISLAGLYVFFLIGGYATSISVMCGFSAAFLHYFMLVYFAWTAVEAIWLYYKLVIVFGRASFETHYIVKAGIPAWSKWQSLNSSKHALLSCVLTLCYSCSSAGGDNMCWIWLSVLYKRLLVRYYLNIHN